MKTIFFHKLLHKYLTRSIEATMMEFTGYKFLIADFQQNTCLYHAVHAYYCILISPHCPSIFRLGRLAQRCAFCDFRLVLLPCTEAWIASCTKKHKKFSCYSDWKRCIFFVLLNLRIVRLPPGITRQQTCR